MKPNNSLFFAAMLLLAACHSPEKKRAEKKNTAVRPTLTAVGASGLAASYKLPGLLDAYQWVSIFPKVNGYVDRVYVDIGSAVKKGQLLMTLKAPELEQATLQARENFARTRANLSIDREHYNRLLEAAQTPGAISPLDLSSVKAKVESDSAVANAAKSNWDMQQTMQGYLQVIAPFSGVITERNVHPGALVSAEARDPKAMLTLKEIDHLRLVVDIPESVAGTMAVNDTISFYTSASPGRRMTARISRKSMNVDARFRSERVEADVRNDERNLAPGMYADVTVFSKGNASGFAVPKTAVVASTERQYVIASRDRKLVRVDVTTGNESGGRIEVFGALAPADSVVTLASDDIATE